MQLLMPNRARLNITKTSMPKLSFLALLCWLFFSPLVHAAADLEVNTPAIAAIKASMQARHAQLASHYASGAAGLTADGMIAIRDAAQVPLAQRQSLNSLINAENTDRNTLYREIASANGHPEWETEVRATFAKQWIQKAQPGWYVQQAGTWLKK